MEYFRIRPIWLLFILSCRGFNPLSSRSILASSQKLDMESLLYKADLDKSSLLHLAVDSGVLKVSWKSVYIYKAYTSLFMAYSDALPGGCDSGG